MYVGCFEEGNCCDLVLGFQVNLQVGYFRVSLGQDR